MTKMTPILSTAFSIALLAPLGASAIAAQEHSSCQPDPRAREELLANAWGADACRPGEPCWDQKLQVLRALRDRFPADTHVHREYQNAARVRNEEQVQEEYEKLRQERSGDAMAIYLYARLFMGEKLAAAAEAALAADPGYPWAHLAQLAAYRQQDPPDNDMAFQHLRTFMELCPSRIREPLTYAGRLGTEEFWRERLPRFRAILEASAVGDQLSSLRQLWAFEFKIRPPTEHEAARDVVRADLARLGELDQSRHSVISLLEHGYELIGNEEALERVHAAQAKLFECDNAVAGRRVEEWGKSRGQEGPRLDLDQELAGELYEASAAWVESCPRSYSYWSTRMMAIKKLADLPSDRLLADVDAYLTMWETQKEGIGAWRSPYRTAAELLLERELDLERLPGLVEKERAYVDSERSDPEEVPSGMRALVVESYFMRDIETDLLGARVSTALGHYKDVRPAIDDLEARVHEMASMPESGERSAPSYRARIYSLRADLAEAEGRRPDAIVQLRRAAAELPDGEVREGYEERARRLWRELGGSDESYAALAAGVGDAGVRAAEKLTPWKEGTEPLAPFELVDLKGETWTNEDLVGKTVLINLWATWCGPCRMELPHLQTLQDELRGREDVQVLTFNVDRNPGLILSYLEKEGLHFEVLLAERYVNDLFGGFAIPQNWIVDEEGVLRLEQTGFGGDGENWLEGTRDALERIASGGEAARDLE